MDAAPFPPSMLKVSLANASGQRTKCMTGGKDGCKGAIEREPSQFFPVKLHVLVERAELDGYSDIVSWHRSGRAFRIHNREQFVKEVMPLFFPAQTRYASFQRQLNLYGFQILSHASPDYNGAYFHKLFMRGAPFLSYNIQRRKGKEKNATLSTLETDALRACKVVSCESMPDTAPSSRMPSPRMVTRHHDASALSKETTAGAVPSPVVSEKQTRRGDLAAATASKDPIAVESSKQHQVTSDPKLIQDIPLDEVVDMYRVLCDRSTPVPRKAGDQQVASLETFDMLRVFCGRSKPDNNETPSAQKPADEVISCSSLDDLTGDLGLNFDSEDETIQWDAYKDTLSPSHPSLAPLTLDVSMDDEETMVDLENDVTHLSSTASLTDAPCSNHTISMPALHLKQSDSRHKEARYLEEAALFVNSTQLVPKLNSDNKTVDSACDKLFLL